MTNNEILRDISNHLNLNDDIIIKIFKLSDYSLSKSQLKSLLKDSQVPGFVKCKDAMLIAFLDGLILHKRGPLDDDKPSSSQQAPQKDLKKQSSPYLKISNNTILKKLRIAFKFHDADMMQIFAEGDMPVSKGELNSWFRKPGHKNYKNCPDQVLQKFLTGLGQK